MLDQREDNPPCGPCFLTHPLVVTARRGIWADVPLAARGAAPVLGAMVKHVLHITTPAIAYLSPAWRISYIPPDTLCTFGGQAGQCLNSTSAASKAFPSSRAGAAQRNLTQAWLGG